VALDLQGYYVKSAEVRLLSPQVLLATYGGETRQTTQCIQVSLTNGISINAHFCPCSRLPLLPFYPKFSDSTLFWGSAFTYLVDTLVESKSILSSMNTNLSASQKELLLWHQRLSHTNVSWIQTLMQDRKWLIESFDEISALHTGPFIHSSTQAKTCNAKGLKCAACLCAKAHSRIQIKKKLDSQHIINEKMLKKEHLLPGSCIFVNHYMSSVMGCPPPHFW
jgi:hypothetical protein